MGHPEHGFSEEDEKRMLEGISEYGPIRHHIGFIFDSSLADVSTGLDQGESIDPDPKTEISEELSGLAMNPNIFGTAMSNAKTECGLNDPHTKLRAVMDQSVPIIPKKVS